jgi:hypothetical protein
MTRPFSPLPSKVFFSNFGWGKSFSRNEGACGNQSWALAKNVKAVSTTKTRMEL